MAGPASSDRVKDGLPVTGIDPAGVSVPPAQAGTRRDPGCPAVLGGLVLFGVGVWVFLEGLRRLASLEGTLTWQTPVAMILGGVVLFLMGPRLFLAASPVNWRSALSSIPDFVTAGLFALTWVSPQLVGKDSVTTMTHVMVLEFIIIHSSVVLTVTLANRGKSRKWMLGFWGLVAMYLIFPLTLSVAAGKWWPLIAFGGLTLNKFAGALTGTSGGTRPSNLTRWGLAALLYLALAFATVVVPFPELGAAGYGGGGEGLWQQKPERALAMGTIYFLLMGFFEFSRGVPGSTLEEVERQIDQANLR